MHNSGDASGAKYKVVHKIENKGGGLSSECFKVPRIMQISQRAEIDNPMQRELENIPLNEPLSEWGGKIDLLLGIQVFWKIIRGIFVGMSDSVVLIDTIYGNVLCGSTSFVGETVMAWAATIDELNK